jgi:uncharacterized protein
VQEFERALVTGASGGIGEAIARVLAARGVDLVLVARRRAELETLAEELAATHGIATEVLRADLLDETDLLAVEDRVRATERPVDLLVNNAGLGTAGPFLEHRPERVSAEIGLNTTALTRLTLAVLPRLTDQGHGGVLNVSSVSSFQPVAHLAVYAATKAYVTSFSQAVHEEVRHAGVTVTALCPGFTRTEFAATAGGADDVARLPGALWQDAGPVATAGVEGVARGRAVVVTGALNQAASLVSSVTPSALSRRVVAQVVARLR